MRKPHPLVLPPEGPGHRAGGGEHGCDRWGQGREPLFGAGDAAACSGKPLGPNRRQGQPRARSSWRKGQLQSGLSQQGREALASAEARFLTCPAAQSKGPALWARCSLAQAPLAQACLGRPHVLEEWTWDRGSGLAHLLTFQPQLLHLYPRRPSQPHTPWGPLLHLPGTWKALQLPRALRVEDQGSRVCPGSVHPRPLGKGIWGRSQVSLSSAGAGGPQPTRSVPSLLPSSSRSRSGCGRSAHRALTLG